MSVKDERIDYLMSQRIDYYKVASNGLKPLLAMESYLGEQTTLDPLLKELIKIRVSQINGCAYCLNMHTTDTRKLGETEQRINCVSAFEECGFYSDQEKSALRLAEKMTLISDNHISNELYDDLRTYFDEKEYCDLVLTISQINSWNRIAISMGTTI